MPAEPVVLIVGSLHHDILIEADHLPRRDETAVGRRWYPKFGGKGGNQAVAVARTGGTARMCGAVGRDGFGAFLLAALDAGNVDRRYVAELDGVGSGMSVAVQDAGGDYAATIVSGANLRIDPAGLTNDALWAGVAVLVLQNEVPEAVNLAAAAEARRRGLRTVLNAAPARPLPQALPGLVDILIVNAIEAEMMGSAPVTDLASARQAARTLAEGFDTVIVTAGAQGLAIWAAGQNSFTLTARKVAVVSSHGAGDVFTGTLAASLAGGRALPEAVMTASDAAAAHVARPATS
jgi:ribokinase